MSSEDLTDVDVDSLTEDNMDCVKSCVGSLPHEQRRKAEYALLGPFMPRDEPLINLIVKCGAERNPTSGMLVPSENPPLAGVNFTVIT